MLLSKNKRNRYLKKLGFNSVLELQEQYFPRDEQDGLYGKKTDKLLRTAYNCRGTHFKVEEFRCGCGVNKNNNYCTGYPDYVRKDLIKLLEEIRQFYGNKPIKITCGLRCKSYNQKLVGSVDNSRHLKGKAVDFYLQGATDTLQNRKQLMKFLKTRCKYAYGNGIDTLGQFRIADNMGNAVHVEIY